MRFIYGKDHGYDSRRLNLSLNYNFGKIKAQQRQTKENEEEKRGLKKTR